MNLVSLFCVLFQCWTDIANKYHKIEFYETLVKHWMKLVPIFFKLNIYYQTSNDTGPIYKFKFPIVKKIPILDQVNFAAWVTLGSFSSIYHISNNVKCI